MITEVSIAQQRKIEERKVSTQNQQVPSAVGATVTQAALMPETVYVTFSAEINVKTTESLLATVAGLVNKQIKTVHLGLSTPGGEVASGLNLYNVLRALPVHLITHNVGNVDSIGNAVFLAGQKRMACAHSTFMFHGVGVNITQQLRFEEKNLREMMGTILSDQNRIGSIIQERTNIDAATVESLFREAQTKDAAYAVSTGIVHEVCDFKIPPGGPVISLVFQR
jgi:ATP-dependent protease ClpP protease subunit